MTYHAYEPSTGAYHPVFDLSSSPEPEALPSVRHGSIRPYHPSTSRLTTTTTKLPPEPWSFQQQTAPYPDPNAGKTVTTAYEVADSSDDESEEVVFLGSRDKGKGRAVEDSDNEVVVEVERDGALRRWDVPLDGYGRGKSHVPKEVYGVSDSSDEEVVLLEMRDKGKGRAMEWDRDPSVEIIGTYVEEGSGELSIRATGVPSVSEQNIGGQYDASFAAPIFVDDNGAIHQPIQNAVAGPSSNPQTQQVFDRGYHQPRQDQQHIAVPFGNPVFPPNFESWMSDMRDVFRDALPNDINRQVQQVPIVDPGPTQTENAARPAFIETPAPAPKAGESTPVDLAVPSKMDGSRGGAAAQEGWDVGLLDGLDEEMLQAIDLAAYAEERRLAARGGILADAADEAGVRDTVAPEDAPIEVDADDADAPAVEVEETEDPKSTAFAAILEMIPDVEPDHLLALIETHLPTYGSGQIVEYLITYLFEHPEYPKVVKGKGKNNIAEGSGSGKRKADSEAAGRSATKRRKIDYTSMERTIEEWHRVIYSDLALSALQSSFPFVPLPFLRKALARHRGLYAPTHLYVVGEEARPEWERAYTRKKRGDKGKGRVRDLECESFEEEKRWLEAYAAGEVNDQQQPEGENDGVEDDNDGEEEDEDLEDDGTFIECGCCFSSYPPDRMGQCPEAHLFCRTCLRAYASNQLGSQNPVLTCMSTVGCKIVFAPSELERILPPKLFFLYERLKQQKELKDAGLEGLEECPFCDWACVIEVSKEEDKLFRCGNEDGGCGVVSCRLCGKKEHVPKTCKEMEDDRHLDGRIAIEEAMTKALMRSCPKCGKAFIKTDGCNKMTCPQCQTLSCYICKQEIKGYDHFHTGGRRKLGGPSKCPLHDNIQIEKRHEQEVKDAYAKAVADYKRDHPDVEVGKDIKVDLPNKVPAPKAAPPAAVYEEPFMPEGRGGFWVMPPVPNDLRVEDLEIRVRLMTRQVEVARQAVGNALREVEMAHNREVEMARSREVEMQWTRLHDAEPGDPESDRQMRAASVNHAALRLRAATAAQDLRRMEGDLERLREDLTGRQARLRLWRAQQDAIREQWRQQQGREGGGMGGRDMAEPRGNGEVDEEQLFLYGDAYVVHHMGIVLLKLPLIILDAFWMFLSGTPPNKPRPPKEHNIPDWRERFLKSLSWPGLFLRTTYWIAGMIEAALLLASMHPSHPLSRFLISTFVWSTPGSISRLRITPTFILGNVLTCIGCLLRLSCYRSLGTFFSFELSLYSDHKLIDTGPYSVVRHPSYTGLTLGILGSYLNHIQGSWVSECGFASYSNAPGLGLAIVVLWVVFSLAVIISLFLRMPNEDAMLKARFGDEWVVWSTKVPYRLLPGVY
ncbi:hypothetical protein DFP72DRAFT_1102545 [Ephemerocybe angulata]|uniref:RING-type domain-containing protein n=1 Tax=Ephemerocybe angulata TaxID=980116 RepID=A0A8H6I5Q2_9AGAR|nr:hypothetical protein DFP72DRAFT_1102545 [Tulosesus angulatus]